MPSADGFGDVEAQVAVAPVGKPYCVVGSDLEGDVSTPTLVEAEAESRQGKEVRSCARWRCREDMHLAPVNLSLVSPAPRIVRAVIRQPQANDIAEGQLVDDTESVQGCTRTSAHRHRGRWKSGSAGDYGEESGRRIALFITQEAVQRRGAANQIHRQQFMERRQTVVPCSRGARWKSGSSIRAGSVGDKCVRGAVKGVYSSEKGRSEARETDRWGSIHTRIVLSDAWGADKP
ncbi:hypothetical protein B0H10DRAFT_1965635 [Mycena sp. CBHHK59/15]|nr:hypothetical protein B0H10DRAFT_1965635 [Mycena sp. CBHHK59/15]